MGKFQISVVATDNAGNGNGLAPVTAVLHLRRPAKPVTNYTVAPKTFDGANGTWLTSPVIKLAATDEASGTQLTTRYAWDSTATAALQATTTARQCRPRRLLTARTSPLFTRTTPRPTLETVKATEQFVVNRQQPTVEIHNANDSDLVATDWLNVAIDSDYRRYALYGADCQVDLP